MSLKVIWTPQAEKSFKEQIDYLESEWTESAFRKFIDKVFDTLELISNHPEMYPAYNLAGIHFCVLNKAITLFYLVKKDQIDLLLFWPNRRDPEKIPL